MKISESNTCPGAATFHPGSICNLACVTCGPEASTRWQKEMGIPIVPGNPRDIDPETIRRAKQMTGVIICGGEPILNHSSEVILEHLNVDQNIRIHFNGTVMPKQSFLDKSARFQYIQYCFSIDGVGERFEYLRWPAKWNQVVDNILWLVSAAPDNVGFAVNITVSQLNKPYYTEVIDWIDQTIPQNNQGVKTVVTFNQAGDNLLSLDYLDSIDKKRNLDWRVLFPKATEYIL
jgi:MoaA/NifB/PqqE/SkfB family radical SAM enzyme